MKFVSWNVNGLRAVLKKDFASWFAATEAEVICLQEIKARAEQVEQDFVQGWHSFWNPAEKAGYSGVASFSRTEPLDVRYGMGVEEHDREGRLLSLEFAEYFVVNCYTPNAQDGLKRLAYRERWDLAFRQFVNDLAKQKPVLIGGDLNVAHEENDLARPKANRKSAGFSDEERAALSGHLQAGFVDSFRHLHPNAANAYSWWSYRGGARARNVGWRIDYWLVSEGLAGQIVEARIETEVLGSDHCPVSLELRKL